MNRNPGLLARLFRRSESPVVAQVFAHAIGQPLLVHPQMGEHLIGAYLHGAIDARPATLETAESAAATKDPVAGDRPARSVAVLNISGPLINRPAPAGLCDDGPLSFVELRQAFDSALADSSVEAIVLRLESPGGMASGCFDLADHIHASRGTKPIYAMTDDYAYSAAYAIAAAADQIWVTRTGGVGSVGVIGYHLDQSGWNSKVGLTVTAIFAGAHKNDGSPHAPLADDVRDWLQQRMDGLRLMFAQSVARGRGMDLQAVLDTEAQVYMGADALAVGFADRLGTMHDLLAHIAGGGDQGFDEAMTERAGPALQAGASRAELAGDSLEAEPAEAAAETIDDNPAAGPEKASMTVKVELAPEQIEAITAAAFTRAVVNAGLRYDLAMALIKRGPFDEPPENAIAHARTVADLCAAAGLPTVAAGYVERNTPLETLRAELQAAAADAGPEIVTTLPPAGAGNSQAGSLAPAVIYQKRNAR